MANQCEYCSKAPRLSHVSPLSRANQAIRYPVMWCKSSRIPQSPEKPRQEEKLIHRCYYPIKSALATFLVSFRCHVQIGEGQAKETTWCISINHGGWRGVPISGVARQLCARGRAMKLAPPAPSFLFQISKFSFAILEFKFSWNEIIENGLKCLWILRPYMFFCWSKMFLNTVY